LNSRVLGFLLSTFLSGICCAQAPAFAWDDGTVPYVVTPMEIVERMLRMGEVGKGDYVIDLGSGDGRIVIEAAKRGARGMGVDIDPALVAMANENAGRAGVQDRAKFVVRDIFETDLSPASVVTMYLLPDFNRKLMPRLLALRPGTRIVSHDYPLNGWLPEKQEQFDLEEKVAISGVTTTLIYVYLVPAKVSGIWRATMPPAISRDPITLNLRQQITRISGTARIDGKELSVHESNIRGERISFSLAGVKGEFTGLVKGNRIEGTLDGSAPWSATLGG